VASDVASKKNENENPRQKKKVFLILVEEDLLHMI